MPPAFHAIGVSLLTGLFFFVLIGVVVRLAITWRGGDRRSGAAHAADLGSYWAAIVGSVALFIALVTGFTIWGGAALNSPVMRNKILAAILVVVTFAIFVAIRWKIGPKLWENKPLAVFYTFVAAAGFHWAMIANSIGGDVAGIPSGYENLVRLSGVETRFTYYLPTWLLATMVAVSVLMLVIAFLPQGSKASAIPAESAAEG